MLSTKVKTCFKFFLMKKSREKNRRKKGKEREESNGRNQIKKEVDMAFNENAFLFHFSK